MKGNTAAKKEQQQQQRGVMAAGAAALAVAPFTLGLFHAPHLELRRPAWLSAVPSDDDAESVEKSPLPDSVLPGSAGWGIPTIPKSLLFALAFASYFLVMSGVIYDLIVEPPSVGSAQDERTGAVKPVAIMQYRINGQFIIEGLSAGMLFVLGGLGFIILDKSTAKVMLPRNRILMFLSGFSLVITCCFMCWVFIRSKIPGYMA
eukprot:TRINITY_DN17946_c0_g1_i1.p2 TRINITY_DN17946_c0_g1~~TRINITY_DN17946_c0_g1_i1.p2  ORF type:complete len:216 (-),score=79.50 TRINITY_DN17946_c0_g1_i1:88-699(-)